MSADVLHWKEEAVLKKVPDSPMAPCDLVQLEYEKSCIAVSNYRQYQWSLESSSKICLRYQEIINFGRCSAPRGNIHHCVMCGQSDVVIPSQNKDVCRTCDSAFWLWKRVGVVLKFCKGCKNFVTLSEFDEKPEASKCGRCRERGRQNYFSKKRTVKDCLSESETSMQGKRCMSPSSDSSPRSKYAKIISSDDDISSLDSGDSGDESVESRTKHCVVGTPVSVSAIEKLEPLNNNINIQGTILDKSLVWEIHENPLMNLAKVSEFLLAISEQR